MEITNPITKNVPQNHVFAGPGSGGAGDAGFRALVGSDIPGGGGDPDQDIWYNILTNSGTATPTGTSTTLTLVGGGGLLTSGSGTTVTITLPDNSVVNAKIVNNTLQLGKIQQIDAYHLLMNSTGSTGNVEEKKISELTAYVSPVTGDLFLVEKSTGEIVKVDAPNIIPTYPARSILGNDTASAAKPTGLIYTDLTSELTPAIGDFVLGWDAAGLLRKYAVDFVQRFIGGQVLISTQDPGAVSTVDFTGLDATYPAYMIRYYDLVINNTSPGDLNLRVGTGATPTWQSGTEYHTSVVHRASNGANLWRQYTAANAFVIANTGYIPNNDSAGGGMAGYIIINRPSSATRMTSFISHVVTWPYTGSWMAHCDGGGHWDQTTAVTGIRITNSNSDNFVSGSHFELYGLGRF